MWSRTSARENRAYGHYFGDTVARDDYPDRIVLYQDTLERDFGHDPDLLRAQVERTLRHELAHHLGWHEQGVRELGLYGRASGPPGEVTERLKVHDWKSCGRVKLPRGFESLPLRL